MEFYKFPYSHYKFKIVKPKPELPYRGRVIAISTYRKEPVRGVAICDFNDEFDIERGKKLAALRCNEKVALKRYKNARTKCAIAREEYDKAMAHHQNMVKYRLSAKQAHDDAVRELQEYYNKLMEE